MIEIKNKYFKTKYYARNITIKDIFSLTNFNQFKGGKSVLDFFYKRKKYFTKVIDLTRDIEEIRKDFSSTVRYKINRAEKDGVRFSLYSIHNQNLIDDYIDYYNTFAESKNLHFRLSAQVHIEPFKENLIVTQALYNGHICAMHGHIVDHQEKIVYLAHSSSHFRVKNNNIGVDKNFIGRANRFLHFKDFQYFKSLGFVLYDMGGYGFDENGEPSSISRFKDGFGGILVQEDHLEHRLLNFIRSVKNIIKKRV